MNSRVALFNLIQGFPSYEICHCDWSDWVFTDIAQEIDRQKLSVVDGCYALIGNDGFGKVYVWKVKITKKAIRETRYTVQAQNAS